MVLLVVTVCMIAILTGMSLIAAAAGTFRTTSRVNLRSEPTTESASLMLVDSGAEVEVLEYDPAGWSKVQIGDQTGYIRSDFLTLNTGENSSEQPAPVSPPPSGDVLTTLKTVGSVNLRTGPSTDTAVIRTLAANTSVEVLENRQDGWSSVRHNGTDGFIKTELISETGAPASQTTATLKTTGAVNLRTGPSTSNSIIVTLAANTNVEVIEKRADGWSSVRVNGRDGFIRSDLLTNSSGTGTILRTVTGVNFRTGPSTGYGIIRLLAANTAVEVLENQTNGWSKVRHNNTEGFIRSDLLGTGTRSVELLDWSDAKSIVPTGVNLRVVDVRTGISFSLRGFAKSGHMDVEPPTKADTDAILRSRNGVWAWAPRPVWVTVGDRTFAAALNGMPHDVSNIRDNGIDGHFCLHFNNTVTNSKTYQRDLNNAVTESYNARPR